MRKLVFVAALLVPSSAFGANNDRYPALVRTSGNDAPTGRARCLGGVVELHGAGHEPAGSAVSPGAARPAHSLPGSAGALVAVAMEGGIDVAAARAIWQRMKRRAQLVPSASAKPGQRFRAVKLFKGRIDDLYAGVLHRLVQNIRDLDPCDQRLGAIADRLEKARSELKSVSWAFGTIMDSLDPQVTRQIYGAKRSGRPSEIPEFLRQVLDKYPAATVDDLVVLDDAIGFLGKTKGRAKALTVMLKRIKTVPQKRPRR